MILNGIETASKNLPLDHHFVDFDEWRAWWTPNRNTKEILVVHLQGDAASILCDVIGQEGAQGRTVGVLFVKGERFSGVQKEERQLLESRYPGQIHFLSYAVENVGQCQRDIEQRFESFRASVAKLEAEARIPWHLLEPPPWPEEIVAVYLALIAKERGTDVLAAITTEMWRVADGQVRELVGRYSGMDVVWEGFDLENPALNSAKLDDLKTILSKIAGQQST